MSEIVSVIVPVYNAEKTLRRCIDSLTNQTYENIEIIIVNDGSTDSSRTICEEYQKADGRVRVISKTNAGVSSARNVGINTALGKYIMFVDSDDYVERSMIKKMLNALRDRDIIFVGYFKEQAGKQYSISEKDFSAEDIYSNSSVIRKLFLQNFINMTWGKLYKKALIGNLRFDEYLSLGEDILFNLGYLNKCNSFVILSDPLYHYEIGVGLHTRFQEYDYKNYKHIWKETTVFFAKFNSFELKSVADYRFLVNIYGYFEGLFKSDCKEKRKIVEMIISENKEIISNQNKALLNQRMQWFQKACMRKKYALIILYYSAINAMKMIRGKIS